MVFYRPEWEEGKGLEKGVQKSKVKSKVKNKEKVIHLISENFTITAQEVAEHLGLSLAGVEKIIRILKQEQRLRRIGHDKGGHWEVKKLLTSKKRKP